MRLPAPLSRRKPRVHKNIFGHVLILAGSRHMVGAAALSSLATMRAGAGLVTVGIPASLNSVIQKKISNVIMTLSLNETKKQSLAPSAYLQIKKKLPSFNAIALGPGLSQHPQTAKLVLKIIAHMNKPLVIDADALNALASNVKVLTKNKRIKIITPHPGEMSRLTKLPKGYIEAHRSRVAKEFAQQHNCVVVLKGHRSIVASPSGQIYVNTTGNAGMATAGSGDVLTGMIVAFLAQGVADFEAARYAVYLHGRAGDLAAKKKTKLAMIASDIVDFIPKTLR